VLLHDLLDATDVLEVLNDSPADVSDVTHDSRSVHPGALFCCVPGGRVDGHAFASAAVDRGAVALLVEHGVAPVVPQARVRSVRDALGVLAARVHGNPSHHVPVVGITGTNGKTTTTFLLEGVFAAATLDPAVIGTVGVRYGGRVEPVAFTTPEAPDLQRTLAALRERGADIVAIEVSSHALSERRVDGTRFAAVCFTNLTHEHLEYHGTLEEYFAAKARLFTPVFSDRAAINIDDAHGEALVVRAAEAGLEVVTYGIDDATGNGAGANVRAQDLRGDATGTSFRLHVDGDGVDLRIPLPGRFNVANALAAAATASALDLDLATIALGLAGAPAVPGRFEPIGSGTPIAVFVDYAHTPDGIETVLAAARGLTLGRVIAVFGCGGDRDPAKRAGMGAAAGRGADVVVLTTDNPRSEAPAKIAAAAEAGLRSVDATYTIELDRREAIRTALCAAVGGDTVLILGKGAETGQQVGDELLPFDDRLVAAEELESAWS
jgi:UDP-N-acetylmuramyl-tripeptide synthetase